VKDAAKDSRAREKWPYVAIPLGIVLLLKVAWPLRNVALVYWVRGAAAYDTGVRVLPGKPTRFSDGHFAPDFPDLVTGFFAFAVAMSAALALSWIIQRVYEKICSRRTA
jgi:hypothetical protein